MSSSTSSPPSNWTTCVAIDWSHTQLHVDLGPDEYGGVQRIVVDRQEIARRYLTTWFLPDLLSSLPIAAIAPTVGRGLRNLRLLRLPRLMKLLKFLRFFKVARAFRLTRYTRTIQSRVNLNPGACVDFMVLSGPVLTRHTIARVQGSCGCSSLPSPSSCLPT